jgi:hypothetical protein
MPQSGPQYAGQARVDLGNQQQCNIGHYHGPQICADRLPQSVDAAATLEKTCPTNETHPDLDDTNGQKQASRHGARQADRNRQCCYDIHLTFPLRQISGWSWSALGIAETGANASARQDCPSPALLELLH